jgi:hypothetical protein
MKKLSRLVEDHWRRDRDVLDVSPSTPGDVGIPVEVPEDARSGASVVLLLALTTLCGTRQTGGTVSVLRLQLRTWRPPGLLGSSGCPR